MRQVVDIFFVPDLPALPMVCWHSVLRPRAQPSAYTEGSLLLCTIGVQVRAWALATSQTVDSRRPSSKWGLKINHGILSWVDRTGKWRGFGPWPSWTLDFRLLLLF